MPTSPAERLLASLTDWERSRPARPPRLSLEPTRRLIEASGLERVAPVVIQVGGSKGKGTTALFLERLAAGAGLRTGVYLSPHVDTVHERVRVGGEPVADAELCAALEAVLALVRGGIEATFFEVMTVAALACFRARAVDVVVLEAGLGARFDATTAVAADAGIVTGVELEHTDWLGETVEEIAGEKAFVVRAGRPAFTAARGAALRVLEGRAAEVGAELRVEGRDFGVAGAHWDGTAWSGELWRGPRRVPFRLDGGTRVELQGLALAWACAETVVPAARGVPVVLDRPAAPGRFEVRSWRGGPLVLDGAHTAESLAALREELDRRFGDGPRQVLFASARGKRWADGLSRLARTADSFVVTDLAGTESEDPEAIAAWLRDRGVMARAVPGVEVALGRLAAAAAPRVVAGSFYLVGEVRRSPHLHDA